MLRNFNKVFNQGTTLKYLQRQRQRQANMVNKVGLMSSVALLSYYYQQMQMKQMQNECCGIVGYIGNRKEAGKVCINGLQILESRGYDSCGIVSIDGESNFKCHKFASTDRFGGDCIKRLEHEGKNEHDNCIAIGHTRWATHGDKTDKNAHPHFDHKNRIALVHNGIIFNYFEIKKDLEEKHGIKARSDTDTEIVCLQIGLFLDQGISLFDSINKAVEVLEGAYSFVLISILDPEAMYIVKNTGTMVIGFPEELKKKSNKAELVSLSEHSSSKEGASGDNHLFQIVSSDTTVFQDYTKTFYNIEDKEILRLSLKDTVETHRI
jgi:glucosamine 6-phosphate synthetase-like amidotransferase/phosphosugar isomerase protein